MILDHQPINLLQQFLDNGVLAWALIACGFAQFSKLLIELTIHRRWRPAVLIETGGMPSSHSALVSGAAAGIGWQQGLDNPLFALAVAVAFVIMYDASGVRRAAGNIASRVNSFPEEIWGEAVPKPLKESLGHNRFEVLVGGIIGPLIVLIGLTFAGSPLDIFQSFGWLIKIN
uniref:Divergent PAP2 family protein n=1 Tax=Paulinella chromatophora TaxID=39717 RepID=B1X5H5_PAUCH|nr:hypothetical protein PCC_0779 [Paulinella chromatophora]ACB43194.1 hypothetical protein PCC_0779 [Paulinella chromatophora]